MRNSYNRRDFLRTSSLLGMLPLVRSFPLIETAEIKKFGNVIDAPADPSTWPQFREELLKWRTEARKVLNHNDAAYRDNVFKWTQSNFSCYFLFMYDRDFYDPATNAYRAENIISRGKKEFGGYDSLVLWHAYPRIGFDERNQFDFYRDMPGGLPALRKATDEFHKAGIKVFINYNPWDTGTRREGKSDIDGLADIVQAIDADGIFLDTLKNAAFDFRKKLDSIKPGIVVEGEIAAELEYLPTHHLSWAQEFGDKYVPGILRNKWFEPRHIQHQISRWSHDHSTELQQAWMNGSGIMIWENVFGQYLPWHDRDKSLLRTILPIQRRYSELFSSEGLTPLINTDADGVFANLWENNDLRLYTLINRHEHEVSGPLITLDAEDGHYYDITEGRQAKIIRSGNKVTIEGKIPARGAGCIIVSKATVDKKFLREMATIRAGYKKEPAVAEFTSVLKKVSPSKSNKMSGDMIEIKPNIVRQVTRIESRECGTYSSGPVVAVSLGKYLPFDETVTIPHLAIDKYPVTNQQYAEFLQSSGYRPRDPANFLKHWNGQQVPAGKEKHPVVYIDINDARAYAAWTGKRLPTEEEWQYVAHGYSWPTYPWGNELEKGKYNDTKETTPVDAFPQGASPFGCMDMCGNTWEMTESEYSDGHNPFIMLKGGSFFDAATSHWYVKGGPLTSDISTKFLLMGPGLDRCSTISFRCVADLA